MHEQGGMSADAPATWRAEGHEVAPDPQAEAAERRLDQRDREVGAEAERERLLPGEGLGPTELMLAEQRRARLSSPAYRRARLLSLPARALRRVTGRT